MEALKKGYYVMLEKPMASNLGDALEIYRAAKGLGRLMVSFTLRATTTCTRRSRSSWTSWAALCTSGT